MTATQSACSVERIEGGAIVTIDATHVWEQPVIDGLKQQFHALIQPGESTHIIVCLLKIQRWSSAAQIMLLAFQAALVRSQGDLALTDVPDTVLETMDITKCRHKFTMFPHVLEALQHIRGACV